MFAFWLLWVPAIYVHMRLRRNLSQLTTAYEDQLYLIGRLRDTVSDLQRFKKTAEDVIDDNELTYIYELME
jgi:hypothetical protein